MPDTPAKLWKLTTSDARPRPGFREISKRMFEKAYERNFDVPVKLQNDWMQASRAVLTAKPTKGGRPLGSPNKKGR
jgi:hypothetical protein